MRRFLLTTLMSCMLLMHAWAQERSVSGKVTSTEDGSALPGVSVVIKGTTNGTVTDSDGNYKLNVPATGGALTFSFIGLQSAEVVIGDRSVVDISLTMDVTQLSEVVVTGLASSIKRSNLANAVGTVNAERLVGVTKPATLDGALHGKIAGANIIQNSGAPGGGMSVQLRGVSSINGSSEPLYIIDGVYVNNSQFENGRGGAAFQNSGGSNQGGTTNRISDINPEDIETIEILKGSSAAAIYGTRANAGVIVITTKKGKSGKTKISFGQDVGFSKAIKLLGTDDWTPEKIDDFFVTDPTNQDQLDLAAEEKALLETAKANGRIYDYEEILFGNTGKIYNTRLSVSGGNEKTKFFVSGSRNDETGILLNTGFQRNSIRANIDHKVSKILSLSSNSNYINSSNARSFTNNDNNGVGIGYNLSYIPNYHFLFPDENGVYPNSRTTGDNPLAIANRAQNDESTNRFIQSFKADINFLQREKTTFSLNVSGGVDYVNTENILYMPDDLQSQLARANSGASRFSKSRSLNTNLQFALVHTYDLPKISFTTQAGTVRLATDNDFSFTQGERLPNGQRNPQVALVQTVGGTLQRWQDVGMFFQHEANFQDKVIGTVGIRFDKSSLNGDSEKFYPFPKASLAVNLAQFDFWSVDVVNQLKLRGAYGETGGLPTFGDMFTSLNSVVIGGRLGVQSPTTLGNENIEPETAAELELGMDIGLMENKIGLELTYYSKNVYDLIQAFLLAPSTGVTSIRAFPVGDLNNRGVEVALNAQVLNQANVTWNTQLQYWMNRSEVTRLEIPVASVGPGFGNTFGRNQLRLGESPTRWFANPIDPETGQLTRYQESQPDFQMSLYNAFTFAKRFEFSFLFHWKEGGYNSNLTLNQKDEGGTTPGWTLENNGPDSPRQGGATPAIFIQDASYLRLREVSLYYTLPETMLSSLNLGIQKVKVGVSGNNLLTFTPYKGYDPEVSNFGSRPVGGNIDVAPYPNTKRLFFHLAVDF
jgi:TonB-linked SusC/RagA family outer membrane protein